MSSRHSDFFRTSGLPVPVRGSWYSGTRSRATTFSLDVMSSLTYLESDEAIGQALGLAAWRDPNTALFVSGENREAGYLLRRLQGGETITMPHLRPMPEVGPRCHELRINDAHVSWRIFVRVDVDAIVILGIFTKKTPTTPKSVIATCQRRIKEYDDA